MRFLVFIKQVPEANEIHFSAEMKTLVRDGVKNIINPFDRRAISEAIRYRNEKGGEVVVATMGPPQAREALTESVVMGADRAVHIEDVRLAGSDSLVTARVLAAASRKIGFDVVFCGQHSIDSETGQVPPQIGELLGVPCATAVDRIEYGDGFLQVQCETDEGKAVLQLPLPAVLSTAERLIKPIKVKDADLASVSADRIATWHLEDLDLTPSEVGLAGSPTWVEGICEQTTLRRPEIFDGFNPEAAAKKILDLVRKAGRKPHVPIIRVGNRKSDRLFWCLLEYQDNRPSGVSLEMLANAAHLASQHGGTVHAIVIRPEIRDDEVMILSSFGANSVYFASSRECHPDDVVALLTDRIIALKPYGLLIPATSTGRIIAGRIAARLRLGLTGDCVGLDIDDHGNLVQLKPAFGGNILASILSKTFPQMATIRPGALPSFELRSCRQIPINRWTIPYDVSRQFHVLAREADPGIQASRLGEADVVICVGMGLGKENVPLAKRLADLMGGAVCATRKVVDNRWLERQYQVGLTGKFIAPAVYLGLGVSGRFNHTIGIQKADRIIAINNDSNSEILKNCDLGITGDCVSITRSLLRILGGN